MQRNSDLCVILLRSMGIHSLLEPASSDWAQRLMVQEQATVLGLALRFIHSFSVQPDQCLMEDSIRLHQQWCRARGLLFLNRLKWKHQKLQHKGVPESVCPLQVYSSSDNPSTLAGIDNCAVEVAEWVPSPESNQWCSDLTLWQLCNHVFQALWLSNADREFCP